MIDLPLDGIRVIDAASFIAAPVVSALMSDYGAEVIKLESLSGDTYRRVYEKSPFWPENLGKVEFNLENRNKKSLSVDLKTSDGQIILHQLVKKSDVFITNLPYPSREELRLTSSVIRASNSKLIYASLTGYGEEGPNHTNPALDATAWWASSGMMEWSKTRSSGELPPYPIPGVGDHPTGLALLSAILLALIKRNKTGKGTTVSTSLFANGIWANSVLMQSLLAGNKEVGSFEWEKLSPLRNLYRLEDNSLFFIFVTDEDLHWSDFISRLKIKKLKIDSRFSCPKNRFENQKVLKKILQNFFSKVDYEYVHNKLRGSKIVYSKVRKASENITDPQAILNNVFMDMTTSDGKINKIIAPPLNIESTPIKNAKEAPNIGEHNQRILLELGYSEAQIENMRLKKIIG